MSSTLTQILDRKGRDVVWAAADATVCDAVRRMNARKIGAVLVGDPHAPVGIFTERDVLLRVVADGRDPQTTLVRDVMTRELVMVHPDTTVDRAMVIVTERRCRHLPVVDESGVCGMISSGDLTGWLVRDQRQTIDDLTDYIRAS